MRIAIVSPLYESVPPKLYGGTERVVWALTEELVALGHDVTLYASGDSQTSARLVACCPRALRLDPGCTDALPHHLRMVDRVARDASAFDVVHWNVDIVHFPVARRMRTPHVTTVHGRLDSPDLIPLYEEFSDIPLVSISRAQRAQLDHGDWRATIHHGLAVDTFPYRDRPDEYLAFLGRVSPEKRPDRAIEIARRTGIPLRIAAKVDPADEAYFDERIRPMLDEHGVDWLGEIGEREKPAFLGGARALLFPIDWPEPFGLVMIEALACGTPVVAFRHGSVPEIIDDGRTGFVVESVEEAVHAMDALDAIPRAACRAAFERRFTSRRMALDYLSLYESVTADRAAA